MSIYSASIDDTDSQIIYSTGWETITSDPFSNWRGTLHSTSLFGSFAFFRFTGSAVAIRCTIPSGAGEQSRVSFSIDDGPARIISQETNSSSQWRHVFWDSGMLEMGPHLLVITNLVDNVSLHLDSIEYEPETLLPFLPASTTSSVVTLSQPKAPVFITRTTSNVFSTFETTSTPTQMLMPMPTFTNLTLSTAIPAVPSSESSSLARTEELTMQILGGVFAGVLFICFFVCLGFALVRRRKRMAEVTFPDDLDFLPAVHKNLSESPYCSFPKEPKFTSSSPSAFTLQALKGDGVLNDFPKGALRNITFQSNHVRPLGPLQSFPIYHPAELRPEIQIPEGFYRPPLPPVARRSFKQFSLACTLGKATVARPHPFSAAALREPPIVHSGRDFD